MNAAMRELVLSTIRLYEDSFCPAKCMLTHSPFRIFKRVLVKREVEPPSV